MEDGANRIGKWDWKRKRKVSNGRRDGKKEKEGLNNKRQLIRKNGKRGKTNSKCL